MIDHHGLGFASSSSMGSNGDRNPLQVRVCFWDVADVAEEG